MRGTYFDGPTGRDDRPTVILVEGMDDAYFIDAILTEMNFSSEDIGVCYVEGKGNFLRVLGLLVKSHRFTSGAIRRYAVIRDADADLARAANEAAGYFSSHGEPVPRPGHVVDRADGRKVGLYLFPGQDKPGDLETLCMMSVVGQPLEAAVSLHVRNVERQFGELDKRTKRMAQAFLAVSPTELCAGCGRGVVNGAFDVRSPVLADLRDFLTRLQS